MGEALKVLWVEEHGRNWTLKVLDGIHCPQGHGSVAGEGERWKEHQGVIVVTQALHEGTSALLQTPISERQRVGC